MSCKEKTHTYTKNHDKTTNSKFNGLQTGTTQYQDDSRDVGRIFCIGTVCDGVCCYSGEGTVATDRNQPSRVLGLRSNCLRAVHMSKLTKTADGFQPSVAVLDTIESSGILRGRLSSYKVKFEIDGQQYTVSTSPLFGTGIMSLYLLEDYNNKTVDIAYNPQTDRVIVMGIVGEDKQA